MYAVLDNLGQLTKCLLCNDTLKEPKILKCFHAFCKNCLIAHAELKEEGKTFSCPSCQTKVDLPQCSDFDSLESSSFHSRIIEVLSIATSTEDSSGVNCLVCKKQKPSTSHCLDCARYLCEQCLDAHNLFMGTHQILYLVDLKAKEYNLLIRRHTSCSKSLHAGDVLEFYCNTCESCVCRKCISQEHKGLHDLLDIEERAEIQKLAFHNKLEALKSKEREDQNSLKVLEETVSKKKVTAEQTKAKVVKEAEEQIAFIEQNKRDLVKQIDEEVQMIIRKKDEQESLLHQTRSASEHVSKLLQYGSAHLIMTTKDSVQKRCEELIALQNDFTDICSKTVFVPTILRQVNIGSLIKTKPTDPVKSTVQVESKLEALYKVKLSVFTKNSAGEPNNDPDDVIDVNISPKEDVKLLKVSEKIGEKYEVEFTPKVPGQFTADVNINGKHVSNSPLVVDVKPQQLKITGQFEMKGMKEPMRRPLGISVNKGNSRIAIADSASHCIAVFSMDGMLLTKCDGQGSEDGQLNHPNGVAFLNDKDVVVADQSKHRIQIFDSTTGKSLKCFGTYGQGIGEFSSPMGVHVDEQGRIIVSDWDNQRVQVFTGDGTYQFRIRFSLGVLEAESMFPVNTIAHGNLFIVSDYANHEIHIFDQQDNTPTERSVIGEISCPQGLAIDNDGNLLVCERKNHCIQKFTLDGRFVGKTCENIDEPVYVAVLADGRFIVSDCEAKQVLYVK